VKDNFSIQSDDYARFRPVYPDELYNFLIPLVSEHKAAWDCGTGNGQVALKLADHFDQVYATDISEKQIGNALTKPNITYQVESAENTSFFDNQFDLITVAQAIHWFDLDKFYKEVLRTLKSGGFLAVIGYSLIRINAGIDQIIDNLHDDILGDYWDDARKLIEEHYSTLPFPFEKTQTLEFEYKRNWTLEELIGYLSTWSALQNYLKINAENPLPDVAENLKKYWSKDAQVEASIPVFMQIARI